MFLEPLILIVLSFIASTFVSAPQKNLEVGKFLVKSHEIFEIFIRPIVFSSIFHPKINLHHLTEVFMSNAKHYDMWCLLQLKQK